MRIVVDTHILVYWCLEPDRLTPSQRQAVQTVHSKNPMVVADISIWEIAMLHAHGELQLDMPLRTWIARAVAPPLVRVAEITANIADEVYRISDWHHRDPADRLIVATARAYGAHLLTNDSRITESQLVPTV